MARSNLGTAKVRSASSPSKTSQGGRTGLSEAPTDCAKAIAADNVRGRIHESAARTLG